VRFAYEGTTIEGYGDQIEAVRGELGAAAHRRLGEVQLVRGGGKRPGLDDGPEDERAAGVEHQRRSASSVRIAS
jgi:hypothetical protein